MIKWSIVILDEAQAIKNPEAKRTSAVKNINREAAIAVTGTPMENRLTDIWSIMDFCFKDFLGTRKIFDETYNNTIDGARS